MHRAANVILSVIAVVREKSQKDSRIPFDKQDLKGNPLNSNISGWYSNSFIAGEGEDMEGFMENALGELAIEFDQDYDGILTKIEVL